MDRRRFIGGVAGNLVAVPLSLWASPLQRVRFATKDDAPNPLSTLATNSARNLGPYASGARGGLSITDYSGLAYDGIGKRMCLFGGGHGASQETDIRVFDLTTLQWSSLYPPTPRAEMVATNGDSDLGRWISTNQPYARHSYNMSLVRGRVFHMMVQDGMADTLDGPAPPYGGRICWYDFDAQTWTYSKLTRAQTPWYYAAAAVLDPASGKIIVLGDNNQAGIGHLWVYDPSTDSFATGQTVNVGYSHDLIYFPPNDLFYVVQSDGRVWELRFDRTNINNSTLTQLAVSGSPPPLGSTCGLAYDSVNRIIGGNIVNGVFHAFDPNTKVWTATSMQTEAGSVGVPSEVFYCLEFDPDSGCFIFIDTPTANMTWAYRYKGASAQPPQAVGVSDLAATLDFGGGNVATFSGASAVDQSDFVGEFVRQKCYLATNPAFPDWRVYFRVDADANGQRIAAPSLGWRDEVVVEYGRATAGTPAHITSPYTATITKSDAAVATYTVPQHWWYARWRYQSSQRAVVRTPATLGARGWIPNFGPQGLFGLAPNTHAVGWAGPMDAPVDHVVGAFSTAMGGTGDNPQIGYLTEYAADYAITGSAPSLTSLRTEGEWCGNWSTHIRDAAGGMPDVRGGMLRYKGDGGTINSSPGVTDLAANPSYVAVETAHFYPCSNMPWLLTDDPFFLEELQFACNWQILFDAYHRTNQGLEGLVYPGQTRSFAWGMRDLFLCAATTPDVVPSWLQPRSVWKACVDDNKTFALRYVNSPARVHTLFRAWPVSNTIGSWQSSWLNAMVGLAVAQGFTDWQPIFAWGVDVHVQMSNGTSGWNKQWPAPYYALPDKAATMSNVTLYYADTSHDATTCTSWADFWAYYKSGCNGQADSSNGHTINDVGWDGHTLMGAQNYNSPSYLLHLRSVLAVAVTRGIAGAAACYDFLQTNLPQALTINGAKAQARFSVDPVTNFGGLWWNSPAGSESGWGINFAHQADVIFATWFTYDASGKAWWLSLTANRIAADTYAGILYQTTGPAFNAVPFDPSAVKAVSVGSGTLTFSDANNGTFAYVVNGIAQTKTITREIFGSPVPSCTFGTQPDLRLATNFQDLWWNAPEGSESGWGINLNQQGDTIFATWFTYNLDGSPLWLTATAPKAGSQMYSGVLYRTSGPPFNANPFNPIQVITTAAGTATFVFADGDNATFSYVVDGFAQAKQITRQVFRAPGTVCV